MSGDASIALACECRNVDVATFDKDFKRVLRFRAFPPRFT